MPIPFKVLRQEGRLKALADTYEKWKADHEEALEACDLEEIVADCVRLATDTERAWNSLHAVLNTGVRFDVEDIGKFVDGMFTRATGLFGSVLSLTSKFVRETGHGIAGVSSLEAATTTLRDLQQRVMGNWPKKDRWPPLNKAMQQQSRTLGVGSGKPAGEIARQFEATDSSRES